MSYIVGKSKKKKEDKPEELQLPTSSFLSSASYDEKNFSLTIDFKNGTTSIHKFLFPLVWTQFKESPSKGSFYARSIKKQYPAVEFQSGLKVSQYNKAVKEARLNAPDQHKTARG